MHLVEARAKHRVTQWDINKKTGIHQSKISLIERGYVVPSEEERQKIAIALGIRETDIEWS